MLFSEQRVCSKVNLFSLIYPVISILSSVICCNALNIFTSVVLISTCLVFSSAQYSKTSLDYWQCSSKSLTAISKPQIKFTQFWIANKIFLIIQLFNFSIGR